MRLHAKLFSGVVTAALVAAGTFAGPAQAGGDYGSPAPAGRTIWEGFHVGAHAGAADYDYGVGQSAPASPLVTIRDGDDGFVGGFVYGSSWQFGNIILGTDSAYNFGDTNTGANVAANGTAAVAEVDWSSESRLRAGFLVKPNVQLYGTVGVAFANIDVSGTLIAGGSDDDRAFGISYGGGAEATLGNRWFARVEYIHTDYDSESFREVGGGAFKVDLDSDVVRGAIGYRFDWSPLDILRGR